MTPRVARTALVVSGGGSRGAYEVGVMEHLFGEVARSLGGKLQVDVLCGTSAGAFNACGLAARADDGHAAALALGRTWGSLSLQRVVQPDPMRLSKFIATLVRRPDRQRTNPQAGSLLDPTPLEHLLRATIPFERIGVQLRAGALSAIAVSATQIATARTVAFVQRASPMPVLHDRRNLTLRDAELRPVHLLASAAIPFLFPPVQIEDQLYCDGSLRQNVPLAPALSLGATALLVITPHHATPADGPPEIGRARELAFADPVYLLGKVLNALTLDRLDEDVERLAQRNVLIAAVRMAGGPELCARLEELLGQDGAEPLNPVRLVQVRASRSIGRLSGEFVRAPEFRRRACGVVGRVMRHLAEGEPEADLLSYLLFDGEFCRLLIEMGRNDARARHEELCALFAGERQSRKAALAGGQ